MQVLDIFATVLAVITIYVIRFYLSKTKQLPLPPGPTPRFWYGNVHQLPKIRPWETYAKWSEIYGLSIIHLQILIDLSTHAKAGPIMLVLIFSHKTIVLNSGKAVLDLLESRSTIYSDRPETSPFNMLVDRGLSVFSISYLHPRFKIYRKLLHSGLNPRAVQTYRPIQEQETRTFLRGLLDSPESFVSHIRRWVSKSILYCSDTDDRQQKCRWTNSSRYLRIHRLSRKWSICQSNWRIAFVQWRCEAEGTVSCRCTALLWALHRPLSHRSSHLCMYYISEICSRMAPRCWLQTVSPTSPSQPRQGQRSSFLVGQKRDRTYRWQLSFFILRTTDICFFRKRETM